jgi:hypothetical protein
MKEDIAIYLQGFKSTGHHQHQLALQSRQLLVRQHYL